MIYIITGHLGSGKTLSAVALIREYMERGCRVAGNVTVNLKKLVGPKNKIPYLLLPSVPTVQNLDKIGEGYDGKEYDERKFGLLVLDEAGYWLNAREWNDPRRKGLYGWITHARKLGWDVALIIQDLEALDSQIRRAISEVIVTCSRLDRIKVPFLPISLPRVHVISHRYKTPDGPVMRRDVIRGTDIFAAFNTRELIRKHETESEENTRIESNWEHNKNHFKDPQYLQAALLVGLYLIMLPCIATITALAPRSGALAEYNSNARKALTGLVSSTTKRTR